METSKALMDHFNAIRTRDVIPVTHAPDRHIPPAFITALLFLKNYLKTPDKHPPEEE